LIFEAQAKYLQQVLEDESLARQLGIHARETINNRFTIDKQLSVFENIYTTVTRQ